MSKCECIICGGRHHYYNCKNDTYKPADYSVSLNQEDLRILIKLVDKDKDKHKSLYNKLLNTASVY